MQIAATQHTNHTRTPYVSHAVNVLTLVIYGMAVLMAAAAPAGVPLLAAVLMVPFLLNGMLIATRRPSLGSLAQRGWSRVLQHPKWVRNGTNVLLALAYAAGVGVAVLTSVSGIPVLSLALGAPLLMSFVLMIVTQHSLGEWASHWLCREALAQQGQQEQTRRWEKLQADAGLGMAAIEASQPREARPFELEEGENVPMPGHFGEHLDRPER